MLKKLLFVCLFSFPSFVLTYAQVGQGALKGKITDKTSKEPLPFVNVVVELNGNIVTGAASDFDGHYTIKPVPPGKYNLKATFTGYQPIEIKGVVVNAEKITFQDLNMTSTAIDIKEFEVIDYKVPLISKDNTSISTTVTRDDIDKLPGRNATSVAQTVGGVYSKDDGSGDLNIRGARSGANYYFIDGIKVRGSSSLPKAAIEEVTVITGGLPAQYGDVTGGVISVTTRGGASEYGGSIDYSTSGYKIGDKTYGLDAFGFNLLEGSVSGPIWFKKDSTGKKTKPLLSFILSGNVSHEVDGRPSAIGWWRLKDDKLEEIKADPLRRIPGRSGTFLNAEWLRMSDLEKVQTRQNAAAKGINLSGKIDVNTGTLSNLTVGGSLDFNKNKIFSYSNSLMNYSNNGEQINKTWRAFTRFTQRFGSGDASQEQKSASTIKNAYFSIQTDVNKDQSTEWDDTFKKDLFKYGHIGKFKTYTAPYYQFGVDDTTQKIGLIQQTYVDTLIGFEPSEYNPEGAAYTSSYYALNGWRGYKDSIPDYNWAQANPNAGTGTFSGFWENYTPFFSGDVEDGLDQLLLIQQNGGLRNGDAPKNTYDIWRSPGLQYNNYEINNNFQYRLAASGSADIKNHAVSVGFEAEQRVDRGYFIGPYRLWTLGRLYTNSHITELDKSNPIIEYFGTYPRISYNRLRAEDGDVGYDYNDNNEPQYFFDYNLRNSLGLDPYGTDWIDFDSYDPSTFSIDMFSADELNSDMLTGTGAAIGYFGYDHTGKKLKNKPTFDDFFTARDEYGNFTRPIGAFRPTYGAVYVQDKFAFDDLIFNAGLRVDYFDANQFVLKDQYSLFPTVRAGEDLTQHIKGFPDTYEPPSNIGDDNVVYVDNVTNPTKIVGFRDVETSTWYNADGAELADASTLRSANGIAPLLVDKTKTDSRDITSASFVDYTPQTNFMPRIAFSFPISDEALFFAHYDVLTKRPTDHVRLNPAQYYYLQSISYEIENPNLKPEKTIDYEAGFQQKLSNTSSVKISAFYREMRDYVQGVTIADAYPSNYRTFANIDFGTVKGFSLGYDMRRTHNIMMKLFYQLQFAEGTGSDATQGLGLARAGKPNLRTNIPLNYDQRHQIVATVDYRYGSGADYNGPVWFDKQVFANTGANFVFNAGSGLPYSRQTNPVANGLINGGGSSLLAGQINGSRLPWQFRADARIDKELEIKWKAKGEGEEKTEKVTPLTIYFQILNVFNAKNIVSIYGSTGNPDDDGYLTAPVYQNSIQGQNNEQSFRELYSAKVNNPNNYNLPRRIRLGLLLSF